MTWDKTSPLNTDFISLGDDVIREMKKDLEDALSHEFSTFPGATAATPIFIPGFLRGATASRPTGDSLTEGRFYCNTTLNVLERYNGTSWDAVSTLIPSGTRMMFFQAAVPTGWTQVTDHNDKMIRIVSGTGGGSGGTNDVSTGLSHAHTDSGHVHSIPEASIEHYHQTSVVQADNDALAVVGAINGQGDAVPNGTGAHVFQGTQVLSSVSGWQYQRTGPVEGYANGNTGSSTATISTEAPTFKYVDCVIGAKD